jgi:hypothetical protein
VALRKDLAQFCLYENLFHPKPFYLPTAKWQELNRQSKEVAIVVAPRPHCASNVPIVQALEVGSKD